MWKHKLEEQFISWRDELLTDMLPLAQGPQSLILFLFGSNHSQILEHIPAEKGPKQIWENKVLSIIFIYLCLSTKKDIFHNWAFWIIKR